MLKITLAWNARFLNGFTTDIQDVFYKFVCVSAFWHVHHCQSVHLTQQRHITGALSMGWNCSLSSLGIYSCWKCDHFVTKCFASVSMVQFLLLFSMSLGVFMTARWQNGAMHTANSWMSTIETVQNVKLTLT